MWRPGSQGAHGEEGAAAVEFAILVSILIPLLMAIFQFSVAWNTAQGLHAAAREGARMAALPTSTTGDITTRVQSALQGVLKNPATATITITPNNAQPCDARAGQTVTVSVKAVVDIEIPLWPGSSSKTLTGTGVFRCE